MTDDLAFTLARLASDDPRTRARTLGFIAVAPTADAALLAACERLLDDRAITLLSLPYSFGEVRWFAADAVAALRQALGITTPVEIADALVPCTSDEVARLAAARVADRAALDRLLGEVAAACQVARCEGTIDLLADPGATVAELAAGADAIRRAGFAAVVGERASDAACRPR